MITSRNIIILFSVIILLTQSACNVLKPKKVSAKDFPPDPRQRVQKNIEEGKGFRVLMEKWVEPLMILQALTHCGKPL